MLSQRRNGAKGTSLRALRPLRETFPFPIEYHLPLRETETKNYFSPLFTQRINKKAGSRRLEEL